MRIFQLIAHIDFLIKGKNRSVIIEAKTVSAPTDEPYEVGFYKFILKWDYLKWNQIQNEEHQIEAYVVAIDINKGWYKIFKIDFSDDLFLMALNKAYTFGKIVTKWCKTKSDNSILLF